MWSKKSLNKILIWIVLGSAVLGVGGVLANKKKANKIAGYIKKWNQRAISFLRSLFKKNKTDEKK